MAQPLLKGTPPLPSGQHPVAVDRPRLEPVHVPAHFPLEQRLRDPVPVNVESPPLPVADTAFYGVGKDFPSNINRTVDTRSFAEWLGVMDWPFKLLKVPSALRVPIAPGQGQNPLPVRVNIDMPAQTSLGAQSSIKARPMWGPQYAKLGVFT